MKLYNKDKLPLIDISPSKEINRGGEGAIFVHPLDATRVVKVYHASGYLTSKALSELMQLPANFIKPLELFYTKTGEVKGFSMTYLDTHRLTLLSNIFNKATAAKEGFTDAVKKLIYENIVKSVSVAHNKGIVIGDLNPYNIFVSNQGDVYFIDVDSFQTPSKKHTGVLLPDIRDWLFNNIDEKSDYYAMSILTFQLFTHVHPYRGVHKSIKTLEERVIKRKSLLSGDPDIIIPSFYEPFQESRTVDQFHDIFQNDKRFIPSLGMAIPSTKKAYTAVPSVSSFSEGDMVIKMVTTGVEDFNCSENFFYVRKGIVNYELYSCSSHASYSLVSYLKAQGVYPGNTNVVYMYLGQLYIHTSTGPRSLTNFRIPGNYFLHYNNGNVIIFDESDDTFSLLNVDQVLNQTNIQFDKGSIFTKSVDVRNGIIQTISGMKWILDISSGQIKTMRTELNINDVYMCPSGQYGVIETKTIQGVVGCNLFSVEGMRITLGTQLNGMLFIAEKGDYLYVPAQTGIDVYRKLDLARVATIACRFVNEQSVLRSCKAGLLCLTGDTLYLLNKT